MSIGWEEHKIREILDILNDYKVIVLIALGYEGATEKLQEDTRVKDQRIRVRKGVKEFVSYNKYN